MNFAKFSRTSILKNICERLLLAPGWRATQKLNRRDLPLLPCLVYINISVGSSFFFFYVRFLYAYLFWFLKLNLQTEKLYGQFRSFLKYNLKEQEFKKIKIINNKKYFFDEVKICWIINFILKFNFYLHLIPCMFLHVNDKVIAQYPRVILTNILLVPHILLFFHSTKGSREISR